MKLVQFKAHRKHILLCGVMVKGVGIDQDFVGSNPNFLEDILICLFKKGVIITALKNKVAGM